MWASILEESHKPDQNAITLSSCPPNWEMAHKQKTMLNFLNTKVFLYRTVHPTELVVNHIKCHVFILYFCLSYVLTIL